MKIEQINLVRITKTEIETREGTKEVFTANFENKEEGIKLNITQDEEFDLVLGEEFSIKIETEQEKL